MKNQVSILEGLDNGEQNESGGGDNRRDYFTLLIGKLQKDIEDLVRICQKVLTLNIKKNTAQSESDQAWTLARQTIRNEAMRVLVLS